MAAEGAAAAVATGVDGCRIGSAFAALLGLALASSVARAAPSDVEVRAARQLFADAEKDEDGARWADALAKLRRVSQVKLTAGIHYHIALCEEHLGQLAAALDEYTSADAQARAEGATDVLRLVGKRIADLGPRVPRLTIRLPPDVADAVVTLDGAGLSPAAFGTALPIDPGEHRIEATASDRPAIRRTVTMRERDVTVIDLELPAPPVAPAPTPAAPALAESGSAPPPPPAAEPPAETSGPSRTGAVLAASGAVVLAGAGVAAFLAAGSAHTRAVEQCAHTVSGATDACDSQKNGVRAWDFTAAGAWLGAAAIGTIAVILWSRPSSSTSSTPSARLFVGPGAVVLGGRF